MKIIAVGALTLVCTGAASRAVFMMKNSVQNQRADSGEKLHLKCVHSDIVNTEAVNSFLRGLLFLGS